MGPFGKEGISYNHTKGKWNGQLLLEASGAKIMKTLAICGVLTKNQAIMLSGCGKNRRSIFQRLVEKGYLDSYEAEQSPKLFSLSEKGAEEMGVPYRTWDTGGLLRLAAANQLWIQIKDVWPGATWSTHGETPVIERSGIRFAVIAPRVGHVDRMLALMFLNKCMDRVLIVAVEQAHALELAYNCPPGRMVRYTWDSELRDGVSIYRFEDKAFAVDVSYTKNIVNEENQVLTGNRSIDKIKTATEKVASGV